MSSLRQQKIEKLEEKIEILDKTEEIEIKEIREKTRRNLIRRNRYRKNE